MPPSLITPSQARALLSSLKYILLDIDGVLWAGDKAIEGSAEAVGLFRQNGLRVRFLSNNASVSRRQLMQNLSKRGIPDVTESEVYNSAYAASLRLLQVLGKPDGTGATKVHGNVVVIGEAGLHEEIQGVLADGFITYGTELHDPEKLGGYQSAVIAKAWRERVLPPPVQRLVVCNGMTCSMFQAGTPNAQPVSLLDLRPVAVVAGLDLHFNTLKLAVAAMSIQGPPADLAAAAAHHGEGEAAGGGKALFVATNEDPQIPIGADNILLPGAGTMVKALATAVGREPDMVCGKPFTAMGDALVQAEGITNPRESCLMVGDRLTTDVAFGNNAGFQSMLVLSGAETLADVEAAAKEGKTSHMPTYIGNALRDFLAA